MAQDPPQAQPPPQPPFPFAFRIRYIDFETGPNVPTPTAPPDHYWRPPGRRTNFRFSNTRFHLRNYTGQLDQDQYFCWSPGRVQPLPPQHRNRFTRYRVSSVFWSNERGGYLHVPYDCTEKDVETSYPWRRLSFDLHPMVNGGVVSRVGYSLERMSLVHPGPVRWISTLLPNTVQATNGESKNNHCGLAGDISLIIALVAFCAHQEHALNAIMSWFLPGSHGREWQVQEGMLHDHHRIYNRGMVVEILAPPQLQGFRRWEQGHYGGILT